ncbi:hypothetical protein ONE63_009452 [Megalurothrips usitatus]|uniref:PDZ domain-containing protein n=1 Tax=Megalurothrips usitatus TaxID=439358 RepID=A0AAV7XKM1_9NEOP|nr:hypothetical protein ONE63_009452 [Megalurothrips usitatus]
MPRKGEEVAASVTATVLHQPPLRRATLYLLSVIAGLSTWGKRVGQKWDSLKRSDSSELLAVSPGRRRHWSPQKPAGFATPAGARGAQSPAAAAAAALSAAVSGGPPRGKRISRVESLRNLFARSEHKYTTSAPTRTRPAASSAPSSAPAATRHGREPGRDSDWVKEECQRGLADLYEQDSLLLGPAAGRPPAPRKRPVTTCAPGGNDALALLERLLGGGSGSTATSGTLAGGATSGTLSYEDLVAAVRAVASDTDPERLRYAALLSLWQLDDDPVADDGHSRLSVLAEESHSAGGRTPERSNSAASDRGLGVIKRRHNSVTEGSAGAGLGPGAGLRLRAGSSSCENLLSSTSMTLATATAPAPPQLSVDDLCVFLNNLLLVKSDESGYESDSTRNGSESPRGSIRSAAARPRTAVSRSASNTSSVVEDDVFEVAAAAASTPCGPRFCRILGGDDDGDGEGSALFARKRGIRRGDVKTLGILANRRSQALACDRCKADCADAEGDTETAPTQLLSQRCETSATAAAPDVGSRKPPPGPPHSQSSSSASTRAAAPGLGLHSMLSQSTLSLTTVSSGAGLGGGGGSGAGRELKTIRVSKDARGDLGVLIERREPGPASYVVSGIETGSAAYVDGRLRVGDELIKVGGRRMRGLTLQEARSALRASPQHVELVVARASTPTASTGSAAATTATATPAEGPKITGMRKFSYRTEQCSCWRPDHPEAKDKLDQQLWQQQQRQPGHLIQRGVFVLVHVFVDIIGPRVLVPPPPTHPQARLARGPPGLGGGVRGVGDSAPEAQVPVHEPVHRHLPEGGRPQVTGLQHRRRPGLAQGQHGHLRQDHLRVRPGR